MVVTGSSAYVIRRYEGYFNAVVTNTGGMLFGFDQKLNGLEWTNDQQPLPNLYTPEIERFLYGKNAGGVSVEYVLGNSYWLTSILNNPVTEPDPDSDSETDSTPTTRKWTTDPNDPGAEALNNSRIPKTQELEIGTLLLENTGSGTPPAPVSKPQIRTVKGALTQSINLKSSVGDPVAITETIVWGIESPVETTPNTAVPINDNFVPLNFVNSNVKLQYTSGTDTTLVKVQDWDLTIARNSELLYGMNDPNSVDSYTKLAEVTGKINLAFDNIDVYNAVVGRKELAEMTLTITNGQTGIAERSLTFTLTGVGLSRHANPDIQPGEPIFQEFDFQARRLEATAVDNTAAFEWK